MLSCESFSEQFVLDDGEEAVWWAAGGGFSV